MTALVSPSFVGQEFADGRHRDLRIDSLELNHFELGRFPLQLLDRLDDRAMFRRSRQRHDLVRLFIQSQADLGQAGQQRLQDGQHFLRIGRQ